MTSKRVERKRIVSDYLSSPKDGRPVLVGRTMDEIVAATGLSHAAVSKAVQDIRNDPAYRFVTVPTRDDNYRYRVATSVDVMLNGIKNQAKHLMTRAESMVTAGEKATTLATSPDEYALAADMKAHGKLMKAQAEAILAAVS